MKRLLEFSLFYFSVLGKVLVRVRSPKISEKKIDFETRK
jgi:hypothetical protein